jgi:hypothetical protein
MHTAEGSDANTSSASQYAAALSSFKCSMMPSASSCLPLADASDP